MLKTFSINQSISEIEFCGIIRAIYKLSVGPPLDEYLEQSLKQIFSNHSKNNYLSISEFKTLLLESPIYLNNFNFLKRLQSFHPFPDPDRAVAHGHPYWQFLEIILEGIQISASISNRANRPSLFLNSGDYEIQEKYVIFRFLKFITFFLFYYLKKEKRNK